MHRNADYRRRGQRRRRLIEHHSVTITWTRLVACRRAGCRRDNQPASGDSLRVQRVLTSVDRTARFTFQASSRSENDSVGYFFFVEITVLLRAVYMCMLYNCLEWYK